MTNEMTEARQGTTAHDGPVLVAVDFTPDSEAALVWACDYAGRLGVPVTVLHVVHDPGEAPGAYRTSEPDRLCPMEDVAAAMMEDFLAKVREKHPELTALQDTEADLVKGIPATRILESAELRNARLIVMGSRGRTGLPHLLLGSKAERVAQLSPIPVTIVKAKDKNDR